MVVLVLLVLLDYGGFGFFSCFFSLVWQVNSLEKVPKESGRLVRADGGDLGRVFQSLAWRSDLRFSVVFCGTRALQACSPLLSGAAAAFYGRA